MLRANGSRAAPAPVGPTPRSDASPGALLRVVAGAGARRIACAVLAVALLPGCATYRDRVTTVRREYFAGNLNAAREQLDLLLEKPGPDRDVLLLEQAVVDLASGKPRDAERTLRTVRDRFDHLEQQDVGETAQALLTDDVRLAYAGDDHERVLIRAFLALSNLMTTGEDAAAYALQIADEQQHLIDAADDDALKSELESNRIALGPYLQAMLHEEQMTEATEVVRARAQVVAWSPDFRDGARDLQRAQHEAPSSPGNGVLYVFALVGRGPIKVERSEVPTQAAMLVADRILSAVAKYDVPPTLAPIKTPMVVRSPNRIQHVALQVNDQPVGETATLVDVGRLAELHGRRRAPEIIGRAVARRALKKGAVYAAKDSLRIAPEGGINLLLNIAGVAWEATEQTDTRCWGLLPDRIDVLRVELPAGTHALTLTPADSQGAFGYPALANVEIEDGRNCCVLVMFPDAHLVGDVLTSRPASGSP